ncbi:hypothetical protein BDV95DRAFT_486030, partial [Massariosphaeria phaeospora]
LPSAKAEVRCNKCTQLGSRKITSSNNRNGNAYRPYYRCDSCDVWITWDDGRGVDGGNPPCECGVVSRRRKAGGNSKRKGDFFWECARGRCGFFEWVQ